MFQFFTEKIEKILNFFEKKSEFLWKNLNIFKKSLEKKSEIWGKKIRKFLKKNLKCNEILLMPKHAQHLTIKASHSVSPLGELESLGV